jgi:hypothetical protein
MANYGDHELFGPGIEASKLIDRLKIGNDSECILFPVGTFATKEQSKIKDLIGTDKRLRQMAQGLDIEHAMPIQRYSWPKIHKSRFANLFISPEATGKTYAILLYSFTKCLAVASISETEEVMNGDSNRHVPNEHSPEELITHPKYIIICSSQDNVESLYRIMDHIKEKAYGENTPDAKRHLLAPVTRTVKLDHETDKLAQRCIESDILIGSPQVIIKCLEQGFINFNRCKKVFFDDLDVALQLHNNHIRELIKIYIIQVENRKNSDSTSSTNSCLIQMFSRKWTDLVMRFITSVFPQRTILFSSIAEAAIYSSIRFEVESYEKPTKDKISVLTCLLEQLLADCSKKREKVALVCKTDSEAELVSNKLTDKGFKLKLLRETEGETSSMKRPVSNNRTPDLLFVLSDTALELEVEFSFRKVPLNDIMHIVHASLPDDMLTFDQRFRLLYKNIQDAKSGMTSTFILNAKSSFKLAKQIYDLASRSSVTLNSTKCLLRNLISNEATQICWRWATTGLCRFEKLSRNDRFGSYCPDRHSLGSKTKSYIPSNDCDSKWPESGMVKITLTHIISPSEFYFMFEAYKMTDSGKWINFESSGCEFMKKLQNDLNALSSVPTRSIVLDKIVKGMIYAVHFPQESRVDRVLILDEPKHEKSNLLINKDLEYSKLISVFKIDHGVCVDVYVKNLIELPTELAKVPGQCHRGFHLGYKPPDNEPNWLYKSKKHFYDILCVNQVQKVTAWIRMSREGCFWFEGMSVTRKLINIDSNDTWTVNPYEELRALKLADPVITQLAILPPSTRRGDLQVESC